MTVWFADLIESMPTKVSPSFGWAAETWARIASSVLLFDILRFLQALFDVRQAVPYVVAYLLGIKVVSAPAPQCG